MIHPFDDDLALAVHACRLRCCGAWPLPAGGTLTGAVQETKHCEAKHCETKHRGDLRSGGKFAALREKQLYVG